ncbi:hypothetical protein FRC04_007617 [Tulasnella sp. 424]|nr:hypothetical protein FRC04_007617 [Tulasnella sp. 424]
MWRRRVRARKAAQMALEKSTISPFDLQGPNVIATPLPPNSPLSPRHGAHSPNGLAPPGSPGADVRVYNGSVINLGGAGGATSPTRQYHEGELPPPNQNPFSDTASMSTYNSNVIPIAYVPPSSNSMTVADGIGPHPPSPSHPFPPARPARSPDLDLRAPPAALRRTSLLDVAAKNDLLAPKSGYGAVSTRSGVSGVSSRASMMSGVSSVYEHPTIVTSAKIGRQVLGVVRAEVVPLPGSVPGSPGSPSGSAAQSAYGGSSPLSTPGLRSRPSIRSPLAGPSFSQSDMEGQDVPPSPPPPLPTGGLASPAMSVRSNPFSDLKSATNEAFLRSPLSPTSAPLPPSRPESAVSPTTPTTPLSALTAQGGEGGRLLTPSRSDYPPMPPVPMEMEPPRSRHVPHESMASFISATSRADSIINNGFVFFPPTPGSGQTAFTGAFGPIRSDDPLPPARRALAGFSTISTSSNMSNGLEAFPFHFGPGGNGAGNVPQSMSMSTLANGSDVPSRAVPFGNDNGARASLDTLALSRDVEAYPLGFDRR